MSNAIVQKLTSQRFEFMHLSKIANIYTAKEHLTNEICQRKFGCVKGA
jgi:hypothetical protein